MMKISSVSISLVLLLTACSFQEHSSYTKEQIDSANSLISRYGLQEMLTYDELRKYPSVMLKNADGSQRFPWVDTYWPTNEKNLARRWSYILADDERNQDNKTDFYLASYFQTEIDALNADELSIYLAPSEKFDIVYRSKKGLTLDAHNAHLQNLKSVEEKQLGTSWEGMDDALTLSTARSLAADYAKAFRSSPINSSQNSLMSLAPLTSEGMLNWLNNSANSRNNFPGLAGQDTDWSWEGICHGWAPAAVYSEEPKFAVKVEVPVAGVKKPLIFTEGDIRGLLSKTWADANNSEQFFIGRRCEKDLADSHSRGPVNSFGRGVSGKLEYSVNNVWKETLFTIVQTYPRSGGVANLMRVILESEWQDKTPRYAYLVEYRTRHSINYKLIFDETQAFAEIEKNEIAADSAAVRAFEMFGCWDVNPASFHTVLIENIGKKNLGFVMDRTQSAQVWNQPIGAAEFKISELKDVATLGESDAARLYRAPGTAFIAEVKASVHWGAEPHAPSFLYSANGDVDAEHSRTSTYSYTLEFDANKRLIGGEWGTLGNQMPDVQNPDFLFGFSQAVEPNLDRKPFMKDGYYGFIKAIHACSLRENADGETEVESIHGDGKDTIKFVNCALD